MNQAEDVEVILGRERRYKFHSGTLARSSTLFADMLTEPNAAKLNSRARNAGIKVRWMIELTRLPCSQYPAGCLELVDLAPTGERADGRSGMVVNENGRIPKALKAYAHYEAVLYAFYGKELVIDDENMSAALSDCFQLLVVSDYLGCTGLVRKPIEVALFKHGQGLFRAIQGAPCRWVELAYRIRSELIFKECMIHLVGNWKKIKENKSVDILLHTVPGLRDLIEKYHRVLVAKCKQLEDGFTSYYPPRMRLPVDDLPIKREAYAKDILIWMALSFFRQWIAQHLNMEEGRHSQDCGYGLYKQIGTAGESYMDKSIINQFHTHFPMTKKAMNVLENHLLEIKECMKSIVNQHAILKSNCQLDVNRFPVKYLTCTAFQRKDYPWLNAEVPAKVVPAKRDYKPGGNEIARQTLDTARMFQDQSLSVEASEEREEDFEESDTEDVPTTSRTKRTRIG
ncbi:uncharacterized protein K460DRAFT_334981 [Cucurbitaria berberidis CBS 394.84]|uniref:BTB domain-containing protein n=1 Tax=Cucurbitaria berberidis CBS 394.84 TaxID=1168544 RepID=A0A9P4GN58_9PLEO|nr:uncharacterized protein K460DRAFT_334981 [Cucurbitaria berberidis CBS 394.84]KAF1848640.1 hypothetical protein K460DRAFT_334981 [Cucurbitaria berberidis CBS 394.84]